MIYTNYAEQPQNGFIAGLIGGAILSLISITLTQIFAFIQKKVDHKNNLQKISFAKRLEKAEDAIGYYYATHAALLDMKCGLQVLLLNIDNGSSLSVMFELISKTGKTFEELSGQKNQSVFSVNLYFDFVDFENWEEQEKKFLESLSNSKSIGDELFFWYSKSIEAANDDNVTVRDCDDHIKDLMRKYKLSLQDLINYLEKSIIKTGAIINAIKTQMRLEF